jgi:DNA-binding transcriptional LysR family regulator
MIRNLDIALVRTFVAVAEHANMTAAGNALHLTQSAVSQQIARLEDLSGVLFTRDRPGLRLTATGERLLGRARRLLALNDELWSDMTARIVEGRVRLGAPYDLVGTCLAPILKSYAEDHPRVEITLVCAASPELLAATAQAEIDLALIEEPVGPSRGECLAVDRLVWVGARAGTAHLKTPLPISMSPRPAPSGLRCWRRSVSGIWSGARCSRAAASTRPPRPCGRIWPLPPG